MIAPDAECIADPSLLQLTRLSRNLYPSFVERLRTVVPEIDVALLTAPHFLVVPPHTASSGSALQALSGKQLHTLEPTLAGGAVDSAFLARDDVSVDARQLMNAVTLACQRLGVLISHDMHVSRLNWAPGGRTVESLTTDSGLTLRASHYVLMSGSWLRELLPHVPIRPIKGQMLSLSLPPPSGAPPLRHALFASDVYIVPKRSAVYVGATVEDVGFDTTVTAGGIAQLLNAATRLVPSLADLSVEEAWAGLRSSTPDLLPVIGAPAGCDNLSVASGFHRNGIALVPVVSMVVAAAAAQQTASLDSSVITPLQQFSPDRFYSDDAPHSSGSAPPAPQSTYVTFSPPSAPASATDGARTASDLVNAPETQPSASSRLATSSSSTKSPESESIAPNNQPRSSPVANSSADNDSGTQKTGSPKMFRILKDGSKAPIVPPKGWKQSPRPKSDTPVKLTPMVPPSDYISPSSIPKNSSSLSSPSSTPPPPPSSQSPVVSSSGASKASPVLNGVSPSGNVLQQQQQQQASPEEEEEQAEEQQPLDFSDQTDGYHDLMKGKGREQQEERERMARAHNRAFGRRPSYLEGGTYGTTLSLSAEEVELFDRALEQGKQDVATFENEKSLRAAQADLEILRRSGVAPSILADQASDGIADDGRSSSNSELSTDGYY